jgi:hypothetical protein
MLESCIHLKWATKLPTEDAPLNAPLYEQLRGSVLHVAACSNVKRGNSKRLVTAGCSTMCAAVLP